MKKKMTFALCFCNRGFMPGELIYGARDDMVKAVTDAGYEVVSGPRTTGDGYYESCVVALEGNQIEITA